MGAPVGEPRWKVPARTARLAVAWEGPSAALGQLSLRASPGQRWGVRVLTGVTWLFAPSRDQKGPGGRTSEARAWVGQGNSKLRRKLQVPGQGGSVMDAPPQKPQQRYTSANTRPSSRLEPSEAGGGVGSCLTCGCPHLPGDLPKARWDSDWGHLCWRGPRVRPLQVRTAGQGPRHAPRSK